MVDIKTSDTATKKVCKKCGGSDFDNSRHCKACRKLYAESWRAKNPDYAKAHQIGYYEKNKTVILEKQAAYAQENPEKYKAKKAKYREKNRDSVKAGVAAWKAKNRERVSAVNAAWRAENPHANKIKAQKRRARKTQSPGALSKGLIAKLIKLQMGKCPCCKQPLGENFHVDHIIPLALEGENTDSNIQLLRAECNQKKHAKDPIEFMQSRGFLL